MTPFCREITWNGHRLVLGQRTLIMGVLNVTPDSFSDGGCFERLDDALRQADQMVADGADILDIGGESTRPFSAPVSADVEIERTRPVVEHLAKKYKLPLSIDTTKASVAKAALDAGASIINDVSALRYDPELGRLAGSAEVPVVLMHMQGTPKTMQEAPVYENVTGEVTTFLARAAGKAEEMGIARSKIIVDPGFGFGKTANHNLTLLKHISFLTGLGLPVMAGVSRKAFIRKILAGSEEEPLPPQSPAVADGTQAAVAAAVMGGASIVRVHDVAKTKITITLIDAMKAAPDC